MSLLIKPEPFSREVDRLFDRLFDAPRRPALGTGDGPDRGRGPLPAEGRPARACPRRTSRSRSSTACSPSPASARPSTSAASRGWHRIERSFGTLPAPADAAGGRRRRRRHGRVRPRRADRPDPQARAGQAAPDRDRPASTARQAGRGGHRRGEVGRRAGMAAASTSTPATAPPARASCVCAHGEVQHAGVRAAGLERRASAAWPRPRCAALGYEMVLGNTFHLFIQPGHEHDRARWAACTSSWAGARPIITDSGGFQVFSMGHGSVAEEIKRRRGSSQSRVILSIEEEGVSFRSYTDGAERFMGPETSMEVQAALGSDIALAFDECTPFHVDRDYTRALDGAHPPLARPLRGLARRARARRARCCTGSCRAGWTRTCAPSRRPTSRPPTLDGIAIGGSLGEEKDADARGAGLVAARRCPTSAAPPAGHRRRGRHPPRGGARGSTPSTARRPPAWRATAPRWCPTPARAGGST